ncbi:MAG: 50S ribosomal protein L5 [bacterium]|nr:50S ribosomal protein L5 [bacterium]
MKRLKDIYIKEAKPALLKKFSYKSVMAVPRLEKVVVNTSFGKLLSAKTGDDRRKSQEELLKDMAVITGQKPLVTKAKDSIAGFKTRKGMDLGAKVTLRQSRMYDFLEKLFFVVLPRSRDFRGLDSKGVDPMGNFTLGLKEHLFFPEISPEKVRNSMGLEITLVTSAKNKEEGLELLKLLGIPFKK